MENNLHKELTEAELRAESERQDREHRELETRAKALAEQVKIEARERQLNLMKKQIDELAEARKKANESTPVENPEVVMDDPASKEMADLLAMLRKEEDIRKQKEEEVRRQEEIEQNRRVEEEKIRKEIIIIIILFSFDSVINDHIDCQANL